MAKCVCPPEGGKAKGKTGTSKNKGSKTKDGKTGKGAKTRIAKVGKVGKVGKTGGGGGGGTVKIGKKVKRKGHPANMFILYFLDMYRKYGGNMYCVAKECGKRWKSLPQSEKDKYKRQYCTKCKGCKSCNKHGGGK